ncbi:MAG: O-antigen ligase family protein [Nitrospirae bacterium]|nr:O-antigen ligase family protein [Nitrospirota bacterium]
MISNMLAVIIVLATLLFGAVEVWSAAAVISLVFATGLFWSFTNRKNKGNLPENTGRLFLVALMFCGYIGLQLVPLPAAVVSIISPATAGTRDFYRVSDMAFIPLSFDPYLTLHELLRAAAFFVVFFISSIVFRDRENLTKMIVTLIVFGFCLAVFGIVQKATWNDKIYWIRQLTAGGSPFGPFVNRNHFAGFIGMLIPLGLGYTLTRENREKFIFFGFLTVIMTVSLIAALSRGGIISFFSSMALFSLLVVITRVRTRSLWAISVFLIIVAAYVVYIGIDPIINRFYATDITKDQRLIVWQSTLAAGRDFWFTGTGLGTFIDMFHLYSPASVQSIIDHAHNDYLEFMLETGTIGMALLLTFAGFLLYSFAKADFQGKRGLIRIAVIASVFSMMMHSIVDFNLHILSNMLLFAVVLGMLSSLSITSGEKYHRRKSKGTEAKGNGLQDNDREQAAGDRTQEGLLDHGAEDWEKELTQK